MEKNEIIEILMETGLTDKEAKVYMVLLELKEAIPSTISRVANIKRPTAYVILEQLQKRGLVSYCRQDGKYMYYHALPPKLLLEREYNKYTKLEKALPSLRLMHQRFSSQPQMSLFEGRDGLISLFEDSLTATTDISCWANLDAVDDGMRGYEAVYLKKRLTRGINMKCVYSFGKKAVAHKKRQRQELCEIYMISPESFPMENHIMIYDDKISITSFYDQIGVIIQNRNIADSQRTIFNMCFAYARQLEPTLLEDNGIKL